MGRVPKDVSAIEDQASGTETTAAAPLKFSIRKWIPGLSLLGKFGITSLIPIAVLAVVLGQTLRGRIQERILDSNKHAAELIAKLGIQPLLQAWAGKRRPHQFGIGLGEDSDPDQAWARERAQLWRFDPAVIEPIPEAVRWARKARSGAASAQCSSRSVILLG